MERTPIQFNELLLEAVKLWENQWLLLTSGDFKAGHYNTMTVAWGSFGWMWEKPFAQVVVRPVRYTYEFMERYESFTLCAFPRKYRKALSILGTASGRDEDKIARAGLTPTASAQVAAPGFAEAELLMECRKMYWDDFEPSHFLDAEIDTHYPDKDYHRIYFGEILGIEAVSRFRK